MVFVDPNYPRTSNMIEGFHLGFKSEVNRPKPTVQEYFKAVRDQQVSTDYHLDRLILTVYKLSFNGIDCLI